MLLSFQPHGAFRDARPDPEHEQRRENPDPHHRAPPAVGTVVHERIRVLVDQRRQDVADRKAGLQHARHRTAQTRRPMLERQGHARRPLAAHADAEQRAEREEHAVARREPAQEGEDRVPQNREHQRTSAAPAIRGGPRSYAADDAEEQRDAAERAKCGPVDAEGATDVHQQERQDGEVEPVEHPPQPRREKRSPLRRVDLAVPRNVELRLDGGRHRALVWESKPPSPL